MGFIGGAFIVIFYLGIIGLALYGRWAAFKKVGVEGWEGLVPTYSSIVQCEFSGYDRKIYAKSLFIGLLMSITYIGLIVAIPYIIYHSYLLNKATASAFGKSESFAIGLTLLGFVFWPILGLGDARYSGNKTDLTDHLIR